MSKTVRCDHCGTVHDSQQDICPTCGKKGTVPAPGDSSMDDTIIAIGKLTAQKDGTPSESKDNEPTQDADAPDQTIQSEAVQAAAPVPPENPEVPAPEDKKPQQKSVREKKAPASNRDKIVCIVLATLVILLGLYIGYRFLRPHLGSSATPTTPPVPTDTTPSTNPQIACTEVHADSTISITAVGETCQLQVTLEPQNTTDSLTFVSSNPAVATVTDGGLVTAVAPGKAVITITCGSALAKCEVNCDIDTEPTETESDVTEPTETEPVGPTKLELNKDDITFFKAGESFYLDCGEWDDLVTWRSSNTAVATVSAKGKVVAVGPGTARIYAAYGDLEVSCIIRCNFTTTVPEPDPDPDPDTDITISHRDVTLVVDESFTLRLTDGDGNAISVSWSCDDTSVCTVSGNRVTAVGSGMTTVRCTYNSVEYTCIVRVS